MLRLSLGHSPWRHETERALAPLFATIVCPYTVVAIFDNLFQGTAEVLARAAAAARTYTAEMSMS